MLETLEILKKIFYEKENINIKTENYNVSTNKTINADLDLAILINYTKKEMT